MSNKLVFLTLALALLFSACRSKKAVMEGRPIRTLSTNKIIDSVLKYRFAPGYLQSKLAVDAELPDDNIAFKVNLRMRLDSIIWAQLQKMVIVGTGLVTRDSIKAINKLKEEYMLNSIDSMSLWLNADLDYMMLQDIILGNPMSFDDDEKYKSPPDTGFYYLSSHRKGKIKRALAHDRAPRKHPVIYQYKFYPKTFKTYMVHITDMNDSTSLQITYPEYELIDSVLVPASAEVEAIKGSKKVKLSMKYTRTKLNEKCDFPFVIPEGYKKR